MPRENTVKLLELCESGVLTYKDVLENLTVNWMSDDEVGRFLESEYEEYTD